MWNYNGTKRNYRASVTVLRLLLLSHGHATVKRGFIRT